MMFSLITRCQVLTLNDLITIRQSSGDDFRTIVRDKDFIYTGTAVSIGEDGKADEDCIYFSYNYNKEKGYGDSFISKCLSTGSISLGSANKSSLMNIESSLKSYPNKVTYFQTFYASKYTYLGYEVTIEYYDTEGRYIIIIL